MDFLEIPKALADMLSQLAEMMQQPPASLEDSPSGRDILSCMKHAEKFVGRELTLFARAVGAHHFNARLYVFEEVRKGKKSHWNLVEVNPAAPQFLPDGITHLAALATVAMETHEGNCVAIWVNPLPMIHPGAYFGLALHKGGSIAPIRIDGSAWAPLEVGDAALRLLVDAMLHPTRATERRWSTIVNKQLGVMRSGMRDDVEAFLEEQGLPGLTDARWEELLSIIYLRKDHLMLLQEVGRSSGVELVIEAQRIGSAMVDLIDKALEGNTEKMASMEKAHARALQRFKTDLAKFKAARDVAVSRTRQVEKELAHARGQLKNAGAGSVPQGGNDRSLGLALDRFFV